MDWRRWPVDVNVIGSVGLEPSTVQRKVDASIALRVVVMLGGLEVGRVVVMMTDKIYPHVRCSRLRI